ncbi:N-terminal glutamine amidase-domain-containing protein [Pisolithus croceorrhizus]|nr:N-terminal glutamine amidase-domain-containing protein [Pisolithus croceorrhizus]
MSHLRESSHILPEYTSMLPNFKNNVYTSQYCEENIYFLAQRMLAQPNIEGKWDINIIFISNPSRTVALWNQRASSSIYNAVIWDYHVILALRGSFAADRDDERGTWVYDLDTRLPVPYHWEEYVERTFPGHSDLPGQFQSLFRVVPCKVYLDSFASDRSHMVISDPSRGPHYLAAPPSYPCICGPLAAAQGVSHNLMSDFVHMGGDVSGFGTVLDFASFKAWCSVSKPDVGGGM